MTQEKAREILDLSEDAVVGDYLMDIEEVVLHYVSRHHYLFKVMLSSRPTVCDLALAYKRVVLHIDGYDALPYDDVYPELMPILYIGSALGLMRVRPSLNEESSCLVDITLRGVRKLRKVNKRARRMGCNPSRDPAWTGNEWKSAWSRIDGRYQKMMDEVFAEAHQNTLERMKDITIY